MTHRAYLNIAVRIRKDETPFPPLVNVQIHSSPPGSLTPTVGELWANVMSIEGDSYAQASERILEIVEKLDAFSWMRPWLREGYEAHQAKFPIYEKRARLLRGEE